MLTVMISVWPKRAELPKQERRKPNFVRLDILSFIIRILPMPVPAKAVLIITGPTASGKTAIAIEVAQYFNTEIISADSRQCYKELSIGVARPSPTELRQVPHHFIASHSIHEEVSAAGFEQHAIEKVAELFDEHDEVVMVGGTGLYIKAFCEGLDAIPPIPASIRKQLIDNYQQFGLKWLQDQIRVRDPDFFREGEMQNPQRLLRALEVLESTGESILRFQKGKKEVRSFHIVKIGLEVPKDELYERINTRVDKMMQSGLLNEVKSLRQYAHLNALQTVGYTELFEYLSETSQLSEAVDRIKQHTRNYAKRQLTWFRKDKEIIWLPPDPGLIIDKIVKIKASWSQQ
jgi:tRNA dimethylallyltransferase